MAARLHYTLTSQQQRLLKAAVAPSVAHRRAQALLLLHEGYPPRLVAKAAAVSRSTVYVWRQRYLTEGVQGLADRPRTGRPLKGGGHYQQMLEEALACEPDALGYAFKSWTVTRLRDHMEHQTGIMLSDGRMRALLHRLGFRYQRSIRRTPDPHPPGAPRQGTPWSAFLNTVRAERLEPLWTWKLVNGLTQWSGGAR
jgi:transposase